MEEQGLSIGSVPHVGPVPFLCCGGEGTAKLA